MFFWKGRIQRKALWTENWLKGSAEKKRYCGEFRLYTKLQLITMGKKKTHLRHTKVQLVSPNVPPDSGNFTVYTCVSC